MLINDALSSPHPSQGAPPVASMTATCSGGAIRLSVHNQFPSHTADPAGLPSHKLLEESDISRNTEQGDNLIFSSNSGTRDFGSGQIQCGPHLSDDGSVEKGESKDGNDGGGIEDADHQHQSQQVGGLNAVLIERFRPSFPKSHLLCQRAVS